MKTGCKAVRKVRSKISFLVQIHQLTNVQVRIQVNNRREQVAILSYTVSASADSGYIYKTGKITKEEGQDGERRTGIAVNGYMME